VSFAAGCTIKALGPQHDRSGFRCGVPALHNSIQRQATRDADRNLAAVFILTADGKTIAGFYTLSAHSILAAELPEGQARKLPRFPLPVTLLGRMALSQAPARPRVGRASAHARARA
jgi:hypothetical protein